MAKVYNISPKSLKSLGKKFKIFAVLFLTACSQTPTDDIAKAATKSVDALEQSLAAECKNDATKAQITAIKTQIENTVIVCENEKRVLQIEKDRLKIIIGAMIFVVVTYFINKGNKIV